MHCLRGGPVVLREIALVSTGWMRPFLIAMTTADYLPVLVQAVLAAGIAGLIIFLSHMLGQRSKKNKIQDTAYECGIKSDGPIHTRFSVKFYLTAMLFILFDIEVVFLIQWAFIYR